MKPVLVPRPASDTCEIAILLATTNIDSVTSHDFWFGVTANHDLGHPWLIAELANEGEPLLDVETYTCESKPPKPRGWFWRRWI